MELFDTQPVLEARARRDAGTEHRDISPAPGSTTGINLDPIRPAVFAPEHCRPARGRYAASAESGTYASATISKSVTGAAVAKGADVPQTAGRVNGWHPRRRIVLVQVSRWHSKTSQQSGQSSFESALRRERLTGVVRRARRSNDQRRWIKIERRSHRDLGALGRPRTTRPRMLKRGCDFSRFKARRSTDYGQLN